MPLGGVSVPWGLYTRLESNRDVVYDATACSTNCILFSCLLQSLCLSTHVAGRVASIFRVSLGHSPQHLDIARSAAYKSVSTLFTSNKFLIVSYLRGDKNRTFYSIVE